MYIAVSLLPWRRPVLLEGENAVLELPALLVKRGIDRVLLVSDRGIAALGLFDSLIAGLEEAGIYCCVFSDVHADPTEVDAENAFLAYKENSCRAFIAFGGGSSLDCTKAAAVRTARPRTPLLRLKGQLRVLRRLPLIAAVPTTAGTGSETTVAAIITDSKTHTKYAINDLALIPRIAVLDPVLTAGLPPSITASTGMDALTHAVEAFIGGSNTRGTRCDALTVVRLIFRYLPVCYSEGENLEARAAMLRASHLAGAAFTRAYVGYVHAVAHTLGAAYGIPHGLANAVVLPHVLEFFGPAVMKPLAELADAAGMTAADDTAGLKAVRFIEAVKQMNRDMGIPVTFSEIQPDDVPRLARRAAAEANPLYPVPRISPASELTMIYYKIMTTISPSRRP